MQEVKKGLWWPQQLDIKTVMLDLDYCNILQSKISKLLNIIKTYKATSQMAIAN
jgi:hypothetical protein